MLLKHGKMLKMWMNEHTWKYSIAYEYNRMTHKILAHSLMYYGYYAAMSMF